jgi:tRNA threonylcarbamoyl adenosine modification protein (Sua5/YciO/YrdC/YwlC family)
MKSREVILRGGIVLAPTETQYGLCCDADSEFAVSSVTSCKGKPHTEPMAVFVRSWLDAQAIIPQQSPQVERLVTTFWPGPLTVVLQSKRRAWSGILGTQGRIGLRCSSHIVIASMLTATGKFLTATSANPHGVTPSANSDQLINWFGDSVELFIFDSNLGDDSKPSTVVDCTGTEPQVIREGAISREAVLQSWRIGR